MDKSLREIILLICSAQAHSDEGKRHKYGQEILSFEKERYMDGYKGKDETIYKAIQLIARKRQTNVFFFVCKDEERRAKYLVYFNFKIEGTRYQISFHSFDKRLGEFVGKGSPTRWEKQLPSRETAVALLALIGERGTIE